MLFEDNVSLRKKIAIGPEMDRPTWTWVGFDLLRELSKYYRMEIFEGTKVPPCDAVISIKEPLPLKVLDKLKKVIYFPFDRYRSMREIEKDPFLKRCSCIISHSKPLADILKQFHPNVFLVNHSGKYILPEMNDYKKDGFILWIGFSIYIPFLSQWLSEHPLDNELVILTDWPGEEKIPGKATQLRWTPKLQFEMLTMAKAALDIKGDDFNQLNKSPEKIHTFIASGIPSACNPGPIMVSLKSGGFDLSPPDQTGRWFSKEYYDETIQYGKKLREEMSLDHIGYVVKEILDAILTQ